MNSKYSAAVIACAAMLVATANAQDTDDVEAVLKQHACPEMPAAPVTDEQLKQIIPDNAPGRVNVRWKLESQENTYGFNLYRSTEAEGKYTRVNPWVIPGDGTTNVPKVFCFSDTPTTRGAVLYYYIEEMTMDGTANIVDGTKGTKVKVKTVEEERSWMKQNVNGTTTLAAADKATSPTDTNTSATR